MEFLKHINLIGIWSESAIFRQGVYFAGALVVLLLINRGTRIITRRRIEDRDLRHGVRKAVTLTLYTVAGILALLIFSDKLSRLGVALGVAGAGIAFALQEVIASFAGWATITFARFFRVGDRVLLGGIVGDVIDIGLLRTTMLECGGWVQGDLYNGRIVRIANSFVLKAPVYNYSGDFPFLWDEIRVPVRYGSDLKFARALFQETAARVVGGVTHSAREAWTSVTERYNTEDASLEPMVSLTADENWVTFTLRYTVDFKKRRSVKDALFTAVLGAIDAHPEALSIASAGMEIGRLPEVSVRLASQ